MGYEGDILIRQGETTWGIERKTFTDALNSWMEKIDTPTHRPLGKSNSSYSVNH